MSLSKLQEVVKDRDSWYAAVHGFRVGNDLVTEQQHKMKTTEGRLSPRIHFTRCVYHIHRYSVGQTYKVI